ERREAGGNIRIDEPAGGHYWREGNVKGLDSAGVEIRGVKTGAGGTCRHGEPFINGTCARIVHHELGRTSCGSVQALMVPSSLEKINEAGLPPTRKPMVSLKTAPAGAAGDCPLCGAGICTTSGFVAGNGCPAPL